MTVQTSIAGRRFLLDGAVFSGRATTRSGLFARHLLRALRDQGAFASVLLLNACRLRPDDEIIAEFALRYAPFEAETDVEHERYHEFTHFLTRTLMVGSFDYYVDSDPFAGPLRLETPAAPTIAALCDDAPLRSLPAREPAELERRYNGLMRLDRADAVVCSSEAIKLSVCRYLGRPEGDVFVLRDIENRETAQAAEPADELPRDVAVQPIRLLGDVVQGEHPSTEVVAATADRAGIRWEEWRRSSRFQVFSSLPGTGCGVADFTMAYLRAAPAQAALHFSSGDPAQVAILDCKLFSYLDFEIAGDLLRVPRLFNFAVSPALVPGLELLRSSGRAGDILIVHERWYVDGFTSELRAGSKPLDVGLRYFWSDDEATELTQRSLSLSPPNAPYPPMVSWLRQLPVAIVSPLSPKILAQVAAYRGPSGEPARNEFKAIEDRIAYVPMGIDDRATPATLRAARRHRIERGIGGEALVIGHFGLILDRPKMLRAVVSAFVEAASELGWSVEGRSIHFKLCGKIVEADLVDEASDVFRSYGAADRLHLSNPATESEFDAEMTACNAMLCFRVQSRGQQSHAMVRALSLGLPVVVNRASGWGYDAETTIEDDDIKDGLWRVLTMLASPESARLRASARAEFERAHRVDGLISMLTDRHSLARSVQAR